jgi:hypothetical protein
MGDVERLVSAVAHAPPLAPEVLDYQADKNNADG